MEGKGRHGVEAGEIREDFAALISGAGVAQWFYARLISDRPQMQVRSLLEALLRSPEQAPVDGNCLH